jgi:hypothetical protein
MADTALKFGPEWLRALTEPQARVPLLAADMSSFFIKKKKTKHTIPLLLSRSEPGGF